MCNCENLPRAVCTPQFWEPGFSFAGHGDAHFVELDADLVRPSDGRDSLARCAECGQSWYVEWLPIEAAAACFAMKVSRTGALPGGQAIASAKKALSVIAHGGVSSSKCQLAGCEKNALNGRALYVDHIPFP